MVLLRAISLSSNLFRYLSISVSDPIALSSIRPPGKCGADIYVGEGQSLGNYLSYGGPYLGIIAVRENLIRKLPGRIVGKTVDINNDLTRVGDILQHHTIIHWMLI